MFRKQLNLTEITLIQAILYILLWMWNDHAATILTLSFSVIAFFVLLISLIAELLERTTVPRLYFWAMASAFVTPLIIGTFFFLLKGGSFDWMELKI